MSRKISEQYFAAVDELTGIDGRFYRITDSDESLLVAVAAYDDVPEDGYTTAFSFGLSDAVHPEWVNGRPELLISVRSKDHAWGLCMGEIVRNYRQESLFSYGTILHFRQRVADESPMTSFLIFASTLLDPEDIQLSLPDRKINLVQMYPIHEDEAEVVRQVGVEKFFWELGIDFDDVQRPSVRRA
ncbi:MAG TPA: suppressor of fused domain protein [Archangium sp.]|nr:suppressor of fused domain protein [Archangium sp.]